MLISCCCCNKLVQSQWLKTTQIYSLTVLEAESPKSVPTGQNPGVSRAAIPPEALGENQFLASSSFWGLWHSLACSHIAAIFKASIFKSLPRLHTASSSVCSIISSLPPFSLDQLHKRFVNFICLKKSLALLILSTECLFFIGLISVLVFLSFLLLSSGLLCYLFNFLRWILG